MRAYISGPLQGSPDLSAARELYERVATIVADVGLHPYVPHLHTDPELASEMTAVEVYRHDVVALNQAGVIIAHVGIPSTGVGAELALAASADKAIIGIARSQESVSRFAAGLIAENGGQLIRFSDDDDLRIQLRPRIAALLRGRNRVAS
ncbi:nucleoside 2-deoxyribosyltransferase [Mycolicibacterium sp. CBM1]